jgi:hypothetical protein
MNLSRKGIFEVFTKEQPHERQSFTLAGTGKYKNLRSAMTNGTFHGWYFHFLQAISEPLDSPQLSRLVREAETAISQRLQELRVNATANSESEAITEAFLSLRYLRDQGIMRSAAPRNRESNAS